MPLLKFKCHCINACSKHLVLKSKLHAMVLIFCVEFRELSHLTRDFSQAEKKITVVTSWATDKMTTIFTQNDNFDHFEWNRCHFVCAFAQLVTTFIFFSDWDKSRVKRPTAKKQHLALKRSNEDVQNSEGWAMTWQIPNHLTMGWHQFWWSILTFSYNFLPIFTLQGRQKVWKSGGASSN